MRLWGYDYEVFAHDWLVCFKNKATGKWLDIVNDNDAVKELFDDKENVFIGYNTNSYDKWIMRGVIEGFSPEELKALNDWIIAGNPAWKYPDFAPGGFKLNNIDVYLDAYPTSLKGLEGHLYMNIVESSIPFDYPKKLTKKQIKETIKYCRHDVDAALAIYDLRTDYFANKVKVGDLAGMEQLDASALTNAQLTAKMLKANGAEHNDEFCLTFPSDVIYEYIPQGVVDFFQEAIDNAETYDPKEKCYDFFIGDCPVKVAWGGIHAAIPQYEFKEGNGRLLFDADVGSFYPHDMSLKKHLSRNIPSYKIFEDILETRMKAKKAGDKATANALKLIVNTTYGASGAPFNDLYDPLMAHSVCMDGQLYLLELAEHLYKDIPGLVIVQLNTDGVMYEIDAEQKEAVDAILKEWQERTGFTLEVDNIKELHQKDVNNYIWVEPDGSIKTKGGDLVRGISTVGQFKVNNDAVVVAEAIVENLVHGVDPAEYINACDDIKKFQFIARASSKFDGAVYIKDGAEIQVQKCNRVYATSDMTCGTLYKTKGEQRIKIPSIPDHCVIDNDNHCAISDVDKSFYIAMANKKIQAFKKEETIMDAIKEAEKKAVPTKKATAKNEAPAPEVKKAPDYSKLNVYQKLNMVRAEILDGSVKQSGKNSSIQYEYFELSDFVPRVTKLFNEYGLISVVRFTEDLAVLTIVNTDNPDENVSFTSPMRYPTENRAINPVQSLGASHTYLRRYLYYLALDLCVIDEIEPTTVPNNEKVSTIVSAPKAPLTANERAETAKEIVGADEPASELQISGLKKLMKKLGKTEDTKLRKVIAKIGTETTNLTNVTKAGCEKYIKLCNKAYDEWEKANMPSEVDA